MELIDLHVHTTASDGTTTPEQAVQMAADRGLRAIAITDHDTASGVPSAVRQGKRLGVEVVPGIEISADYKGAEVHILGYFIDPDSPALEPVLQWVIADRDTRNERIVKRLAGDGYPVSMRRLRAENPDAVIGRPHIAEQLVKLGQAGSVREAFDRYLAEGRPYFIPRSYLPLAAAVDVIIKAGGKAVAAHPLQYGFNGRELEAFIKAAAGFGAVGLETYYSGYSQEECAVLAALAEKYSLVRTGGSDYHGTRKPHIQLGSGDGSLRVGYELLRKLEIYAKTVEIAEIIG